MHYGAIDDAAKMNSEIIYEEDELLIRYLNDTAEDAEFAGRMKVGAFQKEFEHATSKGSIDDCVRTTTLEHRGQESWFYKRHLVAELKRQRAGIIVISFQEDPYPLNEDSDYEQFGCTDICGLLCLAKCNKITVRDQQCYIHYIHVDKNVRGKGVGKCLIRAAEQEAAKRHCQEMFLWIPSDNKAISFFQRQGYIYTTTKTRCCLIWCSTGRWRLKKMMRRLDIGTR